jgi:hypothetical protein
MSEVVVQSQWQLHLESMKLQPTPHRQSPRCKSDTPKVLMGIISLAAPRAASAARDL